MKKQFIVLGAVFLVVVISVVLLTRTSDTKQAATESAIPENDPIDVALEFYNDWLAAARSTTTNPYDAGLPNDARLSKTVQDYLVTVNQTDDLDFVMCQTETPTRFVTKAVYTFDREAQILVLARGLPEKSSRQAVVDLVAEDGKWVIAGITCTDGESAPEREFTFEQDGFLLKSVPPPLNPDFWHLVFTERGTPGHTVPLFFSDESTCVSVSGDESICNPDSLPEAHAAVIKGQMTEAGVNVVRVELVATQ